jgi:hypothetical protein
MTKTANTIVALAGMLALSCPAVAGLSVSGTFRRVTPASACSVSSGTPLMRLAGTVTNPGDGPITVTCPVQLRYIAEGNYWAGTLSATIWVTDRHFSADVSCTLLLAASASPAAVGTRRRSRTSGSDSATKKIEIGPVPYVEGRDVSISCAIPGTYLGNVSDLIAYQVTEVF